MKAPPRLTLSAALTAAILAITTFSPVAAAPESSAADGTTLYSKTDGDLVSKVENIDGNIVSSVVDKATGEPIEFDASQATPRLVDGKPNGAAVMGQWLKGPGYAERAAEVAEQTEAVLDGGPVTGAASSLLSAAAFRPNWGTLGVDVSGHQGSAFNWTAAKNGGARFAYIKATEGTYYPHNIFPKSIFDSQWKGATAAGLIRGAYHFANPSWSSGASQADHFINNGGGWSADGRTLPGLLDMEQSPYTADHCYDLTPTQMVNWIRDFSNRYKARTGRLPAIYTGAYWWNDCTNNSTAFNDHPMMIAAYEVTKPSLLPSGWSNYDIWQYSETAIAGVDSNVFNGSYTALQNLAKNPAYKPIGGKAPYVAPPAPKPAPKPTPTPTPTPVAPGPFKDVPATHVFAQEITWVKNREVLRGWSDGTYRPSSSMTRYQIAAALYRLAGSPAYTPPAVSPFADVPTTHEFYQEIAWLNAKGISTGWVSSTGVRTFKPGQAITRDQTAAFLYRLAGKPAYTPPAVSPFKDVSTRRTFYKEMAWLQAKGISKGWDDGTYRPDATVNRAVMAAFLHRYATRS
ncbi:GH25 family lysozyme [Kocuria rosea]|uniref:GH25 family lysozyme n=1 Tax=Kocuria rosea TaxID=1275 RepID=UPI00203E59B0|nr:GH25 family lysozyme [Kocuria rosea]MCM3688235.1 S-layer homology domain-containing protein [Kocuria rosea]